MWLFRPALLVLLSATLLAQSNPVPLVNNPLVPMSAAPGGPGFTLTVNGTGFVAGSVVNWNRVPLETTFVSASRLAAVVPSANILVPTTASVTVVNPGPGGGASNVDFFIVRQPFTAVSFGSSAAETGDQPMSATLTDLNNDGRPDLVTADLLAGTVSSFLGNDDGTFQLAGRFPAGFPITVAALDVNGDGIQDLVAPGTNAIAALLGNGDGTFQPEQVIPLANFAGSAVASGDFNRDGNLDIAVTNGGTTSFLVFFGNGDGSFQGGVNYTIGSVLSHGLITADFNGDGKLDLAASLLDSTIGVLLANGDGTFQDAVEYPTSIGPGFIIAADLNGDGILDLATACTTFDRWRGAFSILLGNGDGTFQQHADSLTTAQGVGIATADLNGDGKLDFVISYYSSSPNGGRLISTFLGNGDGTFQGQNDSFLFGAVPMVGDLNGDGMLDLVTTTDKAYTALAETAVLSKTSLRFGSVTVGSSRSITVTLSNIGSSAFTVNRFSVNGKGADSFSQTNACVGKSITPGGKCAIRVTFTPTLPHYDTSAMVKISDTGAHPLQTIYLEGFGAP